MSGFLYDWKGDGGDISEKFSGVLAMASEWAVFDAMRFESDDWDCSAVGSIIACGGYLAKNRAN